MRRFMLLLAAMIVLALSLLAAAANADKPGTPPGNPGNGGGDGFVPVTLCHASPTGAGNSGPAKSYELITVDNAGQLNGHEQHPNDIIPAPEGGCPVIEEPPVEPIVIHEVAPSMTEGSCESVGVLTIPEQPEGIIVTVNGPLSGPAETTVTFTAAEGYALTDGRQFAEYVFVLEGITGDCGGTTTEPPVECQEDMPCWDCETMGNRVCGPDSPPEPPVVVPPVTDTPDTPVAVTRPPVVVEGPFLDPMYRARFNNSTGVAKTYRLRYTDFGVSKTLTRIVAPFSSVRTPLVHVDGRTVIRVFMGRTLIERLVSARGGMYRAPLS